MQKIYGNTANPFPPSENHLLLRAIGERCHTPSLITRKKNDPLYAVATWRGSLSRWAPVRSFLAIVHVNGLVLVLLL